MLRLNLHSLFQVSFLNICPCKKRLPITFHTKIISIELLDWISCPYTRTSYSFTSWIWKFTLVHVLYSMHRHTTDNNPFSPIFLTPKSPGLEWLNQCHIPAHCWLRNHHSRDNSIFICILFTMMSNFGATFFPTGENLEDLGINGRITLKLNYDKLNK